MSCHFRLPMLGTIFAFFELGVIVAHVGIHADVLQAGVLRYIVTVTERRVAGLPSHDAQVFVDSQVLTLPPHTRSLSADEKAAVLSNFMRQFPGAAGIQIDDFGVARQTELGFVQLVRISDRTGRLWQVLYAVKQRETGHWLVDDFVILEIPTVSA
jgi:hypothetical protein